MFSTRGWNEGRLPMPGRKVIFQLYIPIYMSVYRDADCQETSIVVILEYAIVFFTLLTLTTNSMLRGFNYYYP